MTLKRVSVFAGLIAVGAMNLAAFGQAPEQPPKKDQPPKQPTTPPKEQPTPGQGMVGKPAPDFAVKDLDGKDHKLADHKGQIVVLQWLSKDCPVCKTHLKDKKTLQNTFSEFKDKGVVWLAVDSNASEISKPDDLKNFAKDTGMAYPILLDKDGRVAKAFGAKTAPQMFIIDKSGVIAYEGAIDNDPTMKDPNARNYVREALQSLVDGSQVATKWSKPYGSDLKLEAAGAEHKEKTPPPPGKP